MRHKTTSIFLLFFLSISLSGQIPFGYYDGAAGKTGETLRSALYSIISGHNSRSYSQLWTDMQSTDRKPNGDVWDIYSDTAGTGLANLPYRFTFGSDQCGNYSSEGDCYNREHSFPKSWFNDASPMYTDLFHLYPTDGKVNGMRGNYPFGEVNDSPSWTSMNGSKRGGCDFTGYTGVVFEPIDAYKGDLARSYFYMITRYKTKVSGWSSPMLSGDGFSDWALNLLLAWHETDPVSQKEMDRNNAIYNVQDNRNPFIDHPEYVEEIWGCYYCGSNPNGEDTIPPAVNSVEATSITYIIIYFDEDVTKASCEVEANYSISGGITVNMAMQDQFEANKVILSVSGMSNNNYTITINNVEDEEGNAMQNATDGFVSTFVGKDETELIDPVKLYPNPAKNVLNIESVKAIQRIEVFRISGEELLSMDAENNKQFEINTTDWLDGLYNVKLLLDENLVINHKILINR